MIVRYRKKLSALLDAQEKTPSAANSPLDNLVANADSSLHAQDLVSKVAAAAQNKHNEDLFDHGATQGSVKPSDFLNMVVPEKDKILVPLPNNNLEEGGKIKRDYLWHPEILHKTNPDWNTVVERLANGENFEMSPCQCGESGCGHVTINIR